MTDLKRIAYGVLSIISIIIPILLISVVVENTVGIADGMTFCEISNNFNLILRFSLMIIGVATIIVLWGYYIFVPLVCASSD